MGGKTNYKPFIIIMKKIPSISSEIDEEKIFKIINEDFSQLAPSYYTLMSQWLINAYKVTKSKSLDLEKYIEFLETTAQEYKKDSIQLNSINSHVGISTSDLSSGGIIFC